MIAPPLSLYIHIPWCVQKCPYCDFNSHGLKQELPEFEYVAHLLDDLEQDAKLIGNRKVSSIFIGGGTPSLFSVKAMEKLLKGVAKRVELSTDAEITMEANPGTLETNKFLGFQHGGVNRISIGVQSFQQDKLKSLGRIHDSKQALVAANYAREAGLNSFNIDLMHGLPQQSLEDAMSDLSIAINQRPPHLSWYQLTIEPNTQFHSKPPTLPDDEILWDIQTRGQALIRESGYEQYEVSGYSLPNQQCQHNLNYWRFGDYIGIGCGAHGKITQAASHEGKIIRTVKTKHPKGYMDLSRSYTDKQWAIEEEELPFEYFMNRFRLIEPCPKPEFEMFTGINEQTRHIQAIFDKAVHKGLIQETNSHWQVTVLGRRYLNSLLELFV